MDRVSAEAHYAKTAVQLLTRLPVTLPSTFTSAWLDRACAYFPLVGLLVGASSGVLLIAASAIWPEPIPALLAILSAIGLTGALHEDGLADTADGLGGANTAEQRLAIMKDSRVGTYGVLALVVALALKVSALSVLAPVDAAFALILGHMSARVVPVLACARLPYAGDAGTAKIGQLQPSARRQWFAVATGLLPFALVPIPVALLALTLAALAASAVLGKARHAIGGVTGDVLGAAEQVFEVGILLGLTAGSVSGA